MVNYLLTSTFIHTIILLGLCLSPDSVITSSATKIEVNIVERPKKSQNNLILPTVVNHAKLRGPGGRNKKEQKVDLTKYENRLKALIDPIWYGHVQPLEYHILKQYTTIVLIFPDIHGNIVSTKVIKGSGDSILDSLAIQTFREVGQIPIPPEVLVKEGIQWTFVVGERSQ